MAQASFYCPQCQTQRLFFAQEMSHTPHILASVFLCGLWLPIWLLITATYTYRYHCQQCGFSDSLKYLNNPRLRQSEMIEADRRAKQRASEPSATEKFLASPIGIWAANSNNFPKVVIGTIAFVLIGFTGIALISSLTKVQSPPPQPAVVMPVNTEPTGAEILQEVKVLLDKNKGKMADGDYNAMYMKLIKIQPNTAAYPEAQKILKQYKRQIDLARQNAK